MKYILEIFNLGLICSKFVDLLTSVAAPLPLNSPSITFGTPPSKVRILFHLKSKSCLDGNRTYDRPPSLERISANRSVGRKRTNQIKQNEEPAKRLKHRFGHLCGHKNA